VRFYEQVPPLVLARGHFDERPSVPLDRLCSGTGSGAYAYAGHGGRERLSRRSAQTKAGGQRQNETIGRISDFIFGKDGNIYVVLAVGDFTGLSGQLVAIPFRSFKLDDPSGNTVLPGASRAALEKLPVVLINR
jgi:hypothetical protein